MKTVERTFLENFKRFMHPYLGAKMVTFKGIIFYLNWAIGPIMHVYFIQEIVLAIEMKNKDLFLNMMIVYTVTLFIYYLYGYLTRKWGWVITVNGFRKVIHQEYLTKFVNLSNTETEKIGTGKLISIIGTGTDTWSNLLDQVINNTLKVLLTLLFTLYIICQINVLGGLVFVILYMGVHIIGEFFNKKSLIHRRKRQDSWNEYTGQSVKMIMSKFDILQTGRVNSEMKKINDITSDIEQHNKNMATPTHWFYYMPSIFINLVKIFIFVFIGYQVIDGTQPLSLFVLLFGTLGLMNTVIINSMQFYSQLTNSFTKIEKMWDFFDSTPDIVGYNEGKDFEFKNGKIELKNIDFGYIEDKKIFENFSMTIEGGKVTALVGNSGSGKSTLVKLISGYIRQDGGDMLIDDQNLREVNLKSLYRHIGYLTQEPSVFDGTVYDNLTYAIDRELEEGEMDTVLKQAKCEFIYELEKGLDTEIGEKGIRLSGGQRQRLAIAKIFLKNPEIIILDEPTSALDSFSEEQITKALNNLFAGRTVIVIAHRLQTVKHADTILVLENGKITEQGNHDELILQEGIYKKMLDLQSGF